MFKKIFLSILVVTIVFAFSGNHASADTSAEQNQPEPKEIAKPQPSDSEEISSLKEKIFGHSEQICSWVRESDSVQIC